MLAFIFTKFALHNLKTAPNMRRQYWFAKNSQQNMRQVRGGVLHAKIVIINQRLDQTDANGFS